MANSILQTNNHQFWTEVKKVKSLKCNFPTCEVFANKYNALFNSISYDDMEMDDIKNEIQNKMQLCSNGKCYNNHPN